MTAPSFAQTAQRLNPSSGSVELFTLDCTAIGGGLYHWTPGPMGNAPVMFGGIAYQPLPIEGVNFEWNGQGPLPQPKNPHQQHQQYPDGTADRQQRPAWRDGHARADMGRLSR